MSDQHDVPFSSTENSGSSERAKSCALCNDQETIEFILDRPMLSYPCPRCQTTKFVAWCVKQDLDPSQMLQTYDIRRS